MENMRTTSSSDATRLLMHMPLICMGAWIYVIYALSLESFPYAVVPPFKLQASVLLNSL